MSKPLRLYQKFLSLGSKSFRPPIRARCTKHLIDSSRLLTGAEVIWIFPTHISRNDLASTTINFLRFLSQVEEVNRVTPTVAVLLVQWKKDTNEEWAQQIINHLSDAANANLANRLVTFSLCADKKIDSLNFILRQDFQCHTPKAVGWVDDDVALDNNCLLEVSKLFLCSPHIGVVGARKIAHLRKNPSAKFVAYVKSFTEGPQKYPHGCCMLVHYESFKNGIPERYISDDGYVCLSLIEPAASNPFKRLQICEKATCHFYVGTSAFGSNVMRIRRIMMSHIVLLGDADWPRARLFMTHFMFDGFWPFDQSKKLKTSGIKWCLKFWYLMWMTALNTDLILRGLCYMHRTSYRWGSTKSSEAPK